jgi:hypothetical protein
VLVVNRKDRFPVLMALLSNVLVEAAVRSGFSRYEVHCWAKIGNGHCCKVVSLAPEDFGTRRIKHV